MQQIAGQVTITEWIKSLEPEQISESKWQCYYCKHLNRNKKQVTGTKRHLYMFGCHVSENGYVPGGAVIGDEDRWLKRFGCGMFNEK